MLEPRRYRYSGWSGESLWNRDITLSLDGSDEIRTYFIARLVFEFLILAALVCFLVGAFFIRQPKVLPQWLPRKGLITSITMYILYEILVIPEIFFFLCEVTVKRSYMVMSILRTAFWMIAFWFILFVFYRIILAYLDRIANGGRRFRWALKVHQIFLLGLALAMIANWSMYVVIIVMRNKEYSYLPRDFFTHYNRVTEARIILSWIMSLEIVPWTFYILAKSRFSSKSGAIALAVGSVFSFACFLESMIVTIMYDMLLLDIPSYLDLATTIVNFVCTVGLYSGIHFCCTEWCKAAHYYSQEHTQTAYQGQPSMPYPPTSAYHPGTQPPAQSGYSSPLSGHGQFPAAGYYNERDATNGFAPARPQY